MFDNGLNVFYTICLDSNIHHPGLGHRELWNINLKSICALFCQGVHQVEIQYCCLRESCLQYSHESNLFYGRLNYHTQTRVCFDIFNVSPFTLMKGTGGPDNYVFLLV